MDFVLSGTGLKMGTDGFRRRGLLVSRLMHGDYDNWAGGPVLACAVVAPLIWCSFKFFFLKASSRGV